MQSFRALLPLGNFFFISSGSVSDGNGGANYSVTFVNCSVSEVLRLLPGRAPGPVDHGDACT